MTEVILLERINNLGVVGDIVNVKNGYARNFLLPRKKALRATQENKSRIESQKVELENENLNKKNHSNEIAKELDNASIYLVRQAGEDGRLFGSVTTRDIAKAIEEQHNIKIDRSAIILSNSIKLIGENQIKISLHAEVDFNINLNVVRSKEDNMKNKL